MIKDAVLHLHGRQPLLADLRSVPGPTDVMVLAHNVRLRDGKRPSFAEDTEAWFLIPVHEISVIELPKTAIELQPPPASTLEPAANGGAPASHEQRAEEADTSALDTDEELLARIRGI